MSLDSLESWPARVKVDRDVSEEGGLQFVVVSVWVGEAWFSAMMWDFVTFSSLHSLTLEEMSLLSLNSSTDTFLVENANIC